MDYIPSKDASFDTYQKNFVSYSELKLEEWKINKEAMIPLLELQKPWEDAWEIASQKDRRTSGDVQAKIDARKKYVKEIRYFVNQNISYNELVSNDEKKELGVTVPKDTRTPVPIPDIIPNLVINKITHLNHQLRITNPEAPESRALPVGVPQLVIFMYISDDDLVPTEDMFHAAGSSTRSLYSQRFEKKNMRRSAWYMACYVNTKGENGPFSKIVTSVIA